MFGDRLSLQAQRVIQETWPFQRRETCTKSSVYTVCYLDTSLEVKLSWRALDEPNFYRLGALASYSLIIA